MSLLQSLEEINEILAETIINKDDIDIFEKNNVIFFLICMIMKLQLLFENLCVERTNCPTLGICSWIPTYR